MTISGQQTAPVVARREGYMTASATFWYVLMCIGFGAGYFAKIPAKKAAIEVTGRGQLTSAEHFWYILQCVAFGAGYFAKIPTKKALAELASAGNLG
jgi:hypothetical protein